MIETVLYQTDGLEIHEWVIEPGESIAYQRHKTKTKVWCIKSGEGIVRNNMCGTTPWIYQTFTLKENKIHTIHSGYWHMISNEADENLILIELQYGEEIEGDIEYITNESELELTRKLLKSLDTDAPFVV
jgi:mannose-6-phosphate isomerase-like protein (cupin superfamily)